MAAAGGSWKGGAFVVARANVQPNDSKGYQRTRETLILPRTDPVEVDAYRRVGSPLMINKAGGWYNVTHIETGVLLRRYGSLSDAKTAASALERSISWTGRSSFSSFTRRDTDALASTVTGLRRQGIIDNV